jgi:cytochrome c553
MEAAMKSLETLNGRYIFDYMKAYKTGSSSKMPEIVKETAMHLISPVPAL